MSDGSARANTANGYRKIKQNGMPCLAILNFKTQNIDRFILVIICAMRSFLCGRSISNMLKGSQIASHNAK